MRELKQGTAARCSPVVRKHSFQPAQGSVGACSKARQVLDLHTLAPRMSPSVDQAPECRVQELKQGTAARCSPVVRQHSFQPAQASVPRPSRQQPAGPGIQRTTSAPSRPAPQPVTGASCSLAFMPIAPVGSGLHGLRHGKSEAHGSSLRGAAFSAPPLPPRNLPLSLSQVLLLNSVTGQPEAHCHNLRGPAFSAPPLHPCDYPSACHRCCGPD